MILQTSETAAISEVAISKAAATNLWGGSEKQKIEMNSAHVPVTTLRIAMVNVFI